MVGTRYSLRIGLLSVLYSSVIGIALGCVSGYYGGKIDGLIMRVMDVFSAIPALVLAIAICAVLGPGINNCIISIAISGTPSYVRMARASVLNVRRMEYLEAATSINCNTAQIIVKHILPNILGAPDCADDHVRGQQHPHRVPAELHRPGRAAAQPGVGRHALRRKKLHPQLSPHGDLPGHYHHAGRPVAEHVGDGLRDALDPKLKD